MLLNVRLGAEEVKAVRGLRRAKVNVSALVRKALRDAAQEQGKGDPKSPVAVWREILRELPTPEGAAFTRPPLTDRRALQSYLRQKLRRR
jgi:hypothetical protein